MRKKLKTEPERIMRGVRAIIFFVFSALLFVVILQILRSPLQLADEQTMRAIYTSESNPTLEIQSDDSMSPPSKILFTRENLLGETSNEALRLEEYLKNLGVTTFNDSTRLHKVPTFAIDNSTTKTLVNIAQYYDIPLVGDFANDITEIHLSDNFFYAGSDPRILALLEQLNNSSSDARTEIIQQLVELDWMRDAETYEGVFARCLTRDTDESVRVVAAAALEEAQSPNSIDRLIFALNDVSMDVRENVRATLTLTDANFTKAKLREAWGRSVNPQSRELIEQLMMERFGEITFGEEDF